MKYLYNATFTPDKTDGGYTITFTDLPEAISQAETMDDAMIEATELLEMALVGRIKRKEPIPTPTELVDHAIAVPLQTALKTALYLSLNQKQLTQTDFSKLMGTSYREASRILSPTHKTKVSTLQKALNIIGYQTLLEVIE